MKRSLLALLGFSLLGLGSVRANDSAFTGAGGTPKLLKGEHRFIAMRSEKVVLVADDKFYDTTADFVFRNDGPATTVTMGFPEGNFGDSQTDAKKSGFVSFATYVDGHKVPARRQVYPETDELYNDAYWLKTVKFKRGQTHNIRVAYRSPMGGIGRWGLLSALSYSFTGKNWKGLVERSDLEIHVRRPGLWMAVGMVDRKPIALSYELGTDGAVFRKTSRRWEAQAEFTFGLTPAVPFWMIDKHSLTHDPQTTDSLNVAILHVAKTFRIGPKPQGMPVYHSVAPHAFALDGVTYVSLSHLEDRLDDFADNLETAGRSKPVVAIKWDASTKGTTLQAGKTQMTFRAGSAQIQRTVNGESVAPFTMSAPSILLHGDEESTLYVPLASVAKLLGLQARGDANTRILEINRGIWK